MCDFYVWGMGVVVLAARACGRAAEVRRLAAAHDATQPDDSDLDAGSSADGSLDATSPSKEPSVSALAGSSEAFFAGS